MRSIVTWVSKSPSRIASRSDSPRPAAGTLSRTGADSVAEAGSATGFTLSPSLPMLIL
jgi:hypothetical protein